MKLVQILIATLLLMFAGSVIGVDVQAVSSSDSLRTELLNTLENLEATAIGLNMDGVLLEKIDIARTEVQTATQAEFEAIPGSLYRSLKTLELSSGQMRLYYDPDLQQAKVQRLQEEKAGSLEPFDSPPSDYIGEALEEPAYPDLEWFFTFKRGGFPSGDEWGSGGGHCSHPGYAYNARFLTMTTAVALEATKDIMEQVCNQDAFGANISVACIVTDVIAYVAIGINESQELCNDGMTAAEVTATWKGIDTIHNNLNHLHNEIHEVIELLNTPGGRRPDWPPPGPAEGEE